MKKPIKPTPIQRRLLIRANYQGIHLSDGVELGQSDRAALEQLEALGLLRMAESRKGRPVWRPTIDGLKLAEALETEPSSESWRDHIYDITSRQPTKANVDRRPLEALRYWKTTGLPCQYVYFIQAGFTGPIKIGSAVDPAKRLNNLQCGNHEELRVRELVLADQTTEATFHAHWREAHIRGEWFGRGAAQAILDRGAVISDRQREAHRSHARYQELVGKVLVQALFDSTTERVAA